MAEFDGTDWSPFEREGAVLDGSIEALAHFDDGHGDALYAAGSFRYSETGEVSSVVRWDGTTWTQLVKGTWGQLHALCVHDDGSGRKLYVGGSFTSIGGVAARGLARWDGTHWESMPTLGYPFTEEFDIRAMVVHDDGSGTALYVGGVLNNQALQSRSIARWRGGAWSALGPGLNTRVDALAVHDDGTGPKLIAGGLFSYSGGQPLDNLAQWDGSAWSSLAGGIPTNETLPFARALLSLDDGSGPALYVGGHFSNVGGIPAANIARLKNATWTTLGSGIDGDVVALTWFDDGTGRGPALYAAGYFANAGGIATRGIARWNGTGWSAVGGGMSSAPPTPTSVRALCAWDRGTGRALYAGGQFDLAGAHPSLDFAQIGSCGETGRTFCFGDGSGAACPCGNVSAPADRAGCLHSLGQGATLRASGEPSLSDDSLVLHGASMTNSAVLYFQGLGGIAGGAGAPFGDGLRCLTGPFIRMATKTNVAGASNYPAGADVSLSVRGAVFAPGTRTYQARFRNSAAFCTSDTFNYTNAVEILWSH